MVGRSGRAAAGTDQTDDAEGDGPRAGLLGLVLDTQGVHLRRHERSEVPRGGSMRGRYLESIFPESPIPPTARHYIVP